MATCRSRSRLKEKAVTPSPVTAFRGMRLRRQRARQVIEMAA